VAFDGIVSAASDTGRSLVPGSLISIYGTNLAQQAGAANSLSSLPTSLGGLSVSVDGRAGPEG
jgi:uncharacterized protein (TIGR03437 family)